LAFEGRLIGACIVVALVLFAMSAVARLVSRSATHGGRAGRLVTVVETTFLPSAASLHVVRVAERYYAIGRSGAHIATLCEIPAESVARCNEPRGGATFFARLRRRRG